MGIKLTTLDVGAGTCHVLQIEEHTTWLIDCGAEQGMDLGERLIQMGVKAVDWLILTNEDEDHLRGLQSLHRHGLAPRSWRHNPTIAWEGWVQAKGGEPRLTDSMETWARMQRDGIPKAEGPRAAGVTLRSIHNPWNGQNDGLNNASLVVQLSIGWDRIIICGDMEVTGWKALKQSARGGELEEWLGSATIWVAAHHGRHNGYWGEGMARTAPDIVIISDKSIVHTTQEDMASMYGTRCKGAKIMSRSEGISSIFGDNQRKVLTTRNDGDIEICWQRTLGVQRGLADVLGKGMMHRTIWIR